MAPFLKVNKAVLVKILTYHEGKELVLAGRWKEKKFQGISDLIIVMSPQNMSLHRAHSDSSPQGKIKPGCVWWWGGEPDYQTTTVRTKRGPSILPP